MSRGTRFLAEVTDKLKEKIQATDAVISESQRDIESMNEYYWENYTEMDQYGYENFDNQQALLAEVKANEESKKYRHRLERMLDSPFFGSVDFVYDGEEEEETFYIGIANFAEKRGGLPLIYDWRAPVSGLFYDFDRGEASYLAPGGRMEGEITSKWQYKICGGKMLYEFESDVKIDDEILRQELSANSDVQLKNIVRTIQKEQNAIIRNTEDKILAIQGVAGSGKTSVALHRIAYLLYHDRKHLRSSDILILSPNSVFSDYISHVLPELGEENIREMSFDLFAYRELQGIVADCEDRYHHIERRILESAVRQRHEKAPEERGGQQPSGTDSGDRYHWKQSRDFIRAMEGFLVDLEDRLVDFRDIEYRGLTKSSEELMKLYYFKFSETPLLSRMEEVLAYFVDEYETLRQCTLAEEELEKLRQRFLGMYQTTDLYTIYNWFLEDNGLPVLPGTEPERRTLEYEDVYPVLYLKYRLCRRAEGRKIRHLVIDEMQDYSYLQYVILSLLFDCKMTILGDRAQTLDTHQHDVLTFLPGIFGKKVRSIRMDKSYRNTLEIAEYAEQIARVPEIAYLKRHGKAVCECTFSSLEEAAASVLRETVLQDAKQGKDGYETAAVLTMTEREAQAAYELLGREREDVFYIDRDSSKFRKGITVTTFYLAKGLEFDQVFILGGDPSNQFFRQFRYISATRALHELYVYEISNSDAGK